jgi:hypothetical protein
MADGTLKVGTITTSSGSGTITLGQSGETINVSGTAGTGFGKILQVQVNANNTLSQTSTNSTTLVDVSGVDVTLTPASTSSKIVIWSNFHFDSGGNNQGIIGTLTYNHSGISQTEVDPSYSDYAMNTTVGGSRMTGWYTMMNYLAPSTTNEITFRMQFSSTGSYSAYFDRKTLRIIAMEYSS